MYYGTIRIGASTTVSKHVLMPYLEKIHEKFPNIEIKIVNGLTETIISELRIGNLDILFLNLPMESANNLKIINILEVQDIFIGNKKYYNLTKGKINLHDLKNYPLIFQKSPSNTRAYLNRYLKDNKIKLEPYMEVVSYNLIMDLVAAGFGIAYATREFIKTELNSQSLYEIKVNPKIPKRHIGIVTLNNTIPNFCTNKLVDLITSKE